MPGSDRTLTFGELRESVAAVLGVAADSIDDEANLRALGISSLGMVRLANRFRRAGLRVTYGQLACEPTLSAWRRRLADAGEPDGTECGGRRSQARSPLSSEEPQQPERARP